MRGITFYFSKIQKVLNTIETKRKRGTSKLGIYNTFTYAINALIEETQFL